MSQSVQDFPIEIATVQTHQPWCRNHHTVEDEPNDIGWCQNTVLVERPVEFDPKSGERMRVQIEPRLHDESDPAIDVSVDEEKLNPDQARRLAAALLLAADLLERVAR